MKLSMIRGTTQTINIKVTNSDGTPYILSPTDTIYFGLKQNVKEEPYALIKKLHSKDGIDGTYSTTIKPEDTIKLDIGTYAYDVGLQICNDFYIIIPQNEFQLLPNVTRKEVSNCE